MINSRQRVHIPRAGGEESFLAGLQRTDGQRGFFYSNAGGNTGFQHQSACDTCETSGAERWRVHHTRDDDEDVGAGAFAEFITRVGKDGLPCPFSMCQRQGAHVVAIGGGFDASQRAAFI